MRVLFVHPRFPGQFGTLLHALAARGGHGLVFLTQDEAPAPPGVTVVRYAVPGTSIRTRTEARPFDAAMRRAVAVADAARGLAAAGFAPDLVIGHEGWGDTLNLRDVWPAVPQVGLREYFYHEHGADVGCDPEFPVQPWQHAGVRARNAVALLALDQGHAGVTATDWQRGLYPAWARPDITVIEDPSDLTLFRPDPAVRARPLRIGAATVEPEDELLTFTASSLEPHRGIHTFLRALPALMRRPRLRVVVLGGTAVSYGLPPPRGTWWDWLLAEAGPRIDRARLIGPGLAAPADHARILQRSDVHAYLSYPFIVSWSLRDALASGCAVLAADTVPARAFVRPGETGVLVPPLDPPATAAAVAALLDDAAERARLGRGARAWAERHLDPARHLRRWSELIQRVSGQAPGL